MSVSDGHIDGLMAHKELDRSKVDSGHYEPGSKGVAEIVEMEIFDLRPFSSIIKDRAHQLIRFTVAV